MRQIDKSLAELKSSLFRRLDIGSLFSRNKVAHKWKAPFWSLSLRELSAWRTQDLLEQSLALFDANQLLGARILLRSAFETVAVLIYLNQLTRNVLSGALDFSHFSAKTATLFLGSRDKSTSYNSLNIITILEKCDARYSGMMDLYAKLSESAHPNCWGMAIGYSDIDRDNYVVTYTNKWQEMYSQQHLQAAELCISVFLEEYNREWPDAFEELETWIEANDARLNNTA